jgi:hypothetical protein
VHMVKGSQPGAPKGNWDDGLLFFTQWFCNSI